MHANSLYTLNMGVALGAKTKKKNKSVSCGYVKRYTDLLTQTDVHAHASTVTCVNKHSKVLKDM